ncbi:hypothetical protein PoB_005367400 [Plakobranchus ocellatus]|uniref:Uncharacterized protein n=1 Tax=Plakobranchus ocellatus TaxID=259542 RepID=A0AAV4C3N7_9GAST|nr:hypothetical protein PoB_005367400 [Plakobranchus ocellatus]
MHTQPILPVSCPHHTHSAHTPISCPQHPHSALTAHQLPAPYTLSPHSHQLPAPNTLSPHRPSAARTIHTQSTRPFSCPHHTHSAHTAHQLPAQYTLRPFMVRAADGQYGLSVYG